MKLETGTFLVLKADQGPWYADVIHGDSEPIAVTIKAGTRLVYLNDTVGVSRLQFIGHQGTCAYDWYKPALWGKQTKPVDIENYVLHFSRDQIKHLFSLFDFNSALQGNLSPHEYEDI